MEKPTQHGAWTGIAVGTVAGILFPPSIIGSAIVGGTAGGVIGHLRRGMSRSDLRELGEELDDGAAALVVVGESRIGEQIEEAVTRARRVVEEEIDAEADELTGRGFDDPHLGLRELGEVAEDQLEGQAVLEHQLRPSLAEETPEQATAVGDVGVVRGARNRAGACEFVLA